MNQTIESKEVEVFTISDTISDGFLSSRDLLHNHDINHNLIQTTTEFVLRLLLTFFIPSINTAWHLRSISCLFCQTNLFLNQSGGTCQEEYILPTEGLGIIKNMQEIPQQPGTCARQFLV